VQNYRPSSPVESTTFGSRASTCAQETTRYGRHSHFAAESKKSRNIAPAAFQPRGQRTASLCARPRCRARSCVSVPPPSSKPPRRTCSERCESLSGSPFGNAPKTHEKAPRAHDRARIRACPSAAHDMIVRPPDWGKVLACGASRKQEALAIQRIRPFKIRETSGHT